ncbi:MAG: tetratricopeptide repeat protein [Gemmataceae bacterium]|nr:tetratricopeptide repeat protein [Gemmataceae bacterium]
MTSLANSYLSVGRTAEALPLYEKALERFRATLRPGDPRTLSCMRWLAVAYLDANRPGDAVPLLAELLQLRAAASGPEHPATLVVLYNLATAYLSTGRPGDAIPLLERYVPAKRKQIGVDTSEFAGLLAVISTDLLAAGQLAAAEPYLRECLAIREKAQPDAWTTFNTRSMLGGSLLGQEKPAEAEPLLLAGYGGMKQRETAIPPQSRARLAEATDRLVELYRTLGKPHEVARWRAERANYPFVAPPPRPAK